MKRYVSFFESLEFKTGDEVAEWLSTLVIPTRKPSNISKIEHEVILGAYKIFKDPQYSREIDFRNQLLLNKSKQFRLDKEEYEKAYSSESSLPQIIKGKYATYEHSDVGSYKRFLDNIEDTEDMLSSLKGYHTKALKNLKIKFVSAQEIKTPAKWVARENAMWINPLSKKVGNTKDDYGSLRYIVVHELGHKFLHENPQSWDYSDSSLETTPYSKKNKDTLSEEEVFAELFALSNWKSKYPQYESQIYRFEKLLQK